MPLPLFRLLIALLVGCVGFQSTVAAAGARCSHAANAMAMTGEMPAGMHHGPGMKMGRAATDPHAQHRAGAQKATSQGEAKTGIALLSCECGCTCASMGCVVSGPGIASVGTGSALDVSPARFAVQHPQAGLRSAHRLDPIRPPSRS